MLHQVTLITDHCLSSYPFMYMTEVLVGTILKITYRITYELCVYVRHILSVVVVKQRIQKLVMNVFALYFRVLFMCFSKSLC